MSNPQVLIAGAGPTGLALALRLARHGISLRIVDKNSGPGQASRALAVHARTIEFYQQLGFADDFVSRGIRIEGVRLRKDGAQFAEISMRNIGEGLSPYPFMLGLGQDEHERYLVDKLEAEGIAVEWGVALKSFKQDISGVRAILQSAGGESVCEAAYLCGCDGGHSRVREELNLDFPGGSYSNLFYVADVRTDAPRTPDLLLNLRAAGFAMKMPVRSTGMDRLIGFVPEELAHKTDLRFEDIRGHVESMLGITVTEVNWFSTYHAHHRVASRFHSGRCFLAGDAGHIHSPAGGQGMNTGIGDAVNLAWKLADVLQGRAPPALLASYDPERLAFAKKLVATTDSAFHWIAGTGAGSRFLRSWIIPHVLPMLTRFAAMRRVIFKTISQTRISYAGSSLSSGKAGGVRGGDRLPWVPPGSGDNFAALQSLRWQLHVYGAVSPEILKAAAELHLPCNEFAWTSAARAAGLAQNAMYLVRPDGHVALASSEQSAETLGGYITRNGLSFSSEALAPA